MQRFLDFVRSPWLMVAVFGILLVAAVVGVVYGVVYGVATHTEPGLMESTPGFGERDLPISVCPGGYVPDVAGTELAYRVARDAVATTNGRLGFAALRVAGPHDDGTGCRDSGIWLVVGAPAEAGSVDPGGAATFDAGSRVCRVTTTNVPSDEYLELVVEHELGHCLGLAHDCWAGSIMCGGSCCTLAPSPDGSFPPRIDDSDRALLRRVFGR